MTADASNPDPKRGGRQRSEAMEMIVKAERLTQIAFVVPSAVLIGWAVGALLDKWLGQHWIYIVGLVMGAVAGMIDAVRRALRAT